MVYGNKIDWVKFCLEHGANPNHNLIRGRHALAGAASKGNIEMVDLLLQHGARLESIYALVEAAIEGHLEMVKYLLLNGADIDEVRIKGPAGDECYEEMGNSLHHAAILGYTEMALFLIDAGANIHLKDLMGRTAEDLALEKNHTEILNALHQKMGTLDDRL